MRSTRSTPRPVRYVPRRAPHRPLDSNFLSRSAVGLWRVSGCGGRRHIHTEDLREIDEAAARIEIQGASYPEALEARTGL